MSLALGTRLLVLVGDHAAIGEWADQLVAITTERGFPQWLAQGSVYRGWAKVKNGAVAEGISLLCSGSAAHRADGAELWMPHFLALEARAREIAGEIGVALVLLDDALQIAERTGARWFAAELNRHKGQLLLRQGQVEEAEKLYSKAMNIAQEQGANLWELRAAASLAGLCRDQGRRTEARDLLKPVYGRFTQGFNTPDLRQAAALLAELEGA